MIYDLKNKENMILYFSLKNKHGYSLDNYEDVLYEIVDKLMPLIDDFEDIFIPESSSKFLVDLVELTNKVYYTVPKNSKDYIRSMVSSFQLQKAERISHLKEIDSMGDSFKINELKANHRKHYIKHLFAKVQPKYNSVIIDDSNFSGSTRDALLISTGCTTYISIFSK